MALFSADEWDRYDPYVLYDLWDRCYMGVINFLVDAQSQCHHPFPDLDTPECRSYIPAAFCLGGIVKNTIEMTGGGFMNESVRLPNGFERGIQCEW